MLKPGSPASTLDGNHARATKQTNRAELINRTFVRDIIIIFFNNINNIMIPMRAFKKTKSYLPNSYTTKYIMALSQ